jgi:YHS domain-containing protein
VDPCRPAKEIDMQLTVLETTPHSLRAGYECACGCRPSLIYRARGEAQHDVCCCGNEFAIGPLGGTHLPVREPFRREVAQAPAPWGEPLEAVWLIGASRHPPEDGHDDHAHGHGRDLEMAHASHHGSGEAAPGTTIDPVCGMTVEPETARARGLHSRYGDVEYFFCGKGCKLDFDEEPERYLDPSYVPSM